MGSCNTTQNERGGKDLLLKICEEIECDVQIGTDDDPQEILTGTAHGAVVGDMVRINSTELGTNDDVTADQLYFIVSVPSTTAVKISATPGGTAITFDEALTDVDFEFFKTVGGLRSSGVSFASEGIDITNYGSNQWRQMKDGAGIRAVSVSGDGVYTIATNYRAMETDAYANNLVCLAFVDVAAGRVYHGCFKITSLEITGEHGGEATFTMAAESAAAITVYQAA